MDKGNDDYEYLHPSTVMQSLLEGCCHHGYYLNVYGLTLCTKTPIQHQQVRQTLLHLFRKVPTLRHCFRRRDGQLWTCEMNREEIDFEVVDDENVTALDVMEELGCYNYNSTDGPCWCARLLTKEKNVLCARQEIKANFPHTYSLILANHHANADGTTCTQTIDFFLQIFNDVLAGKEIDDSIQMREYKGAKEFDNMLNYQDKILEEDPEKLQKLLKDYTKGSQNDTTICRILSPIEGVSYKTSLLQSVFDINTTQSFIKKCKDNGITVNSGFLAVISVSLIDFCKEAGIVQDEYTFKTANSINARRYMPKYMKNILGAHTSLLFLNTVVPSNWQNNFWEYAKKLHQEFYKGLESDPVTFHCLGRRVYYNCDGYIEFLSKFQSPSLDFIAATMNNIDVRIPTDGDHVRLGHILRFSTNAFEPIMHLYHSFRQRMHYTFAYSVNFITKETAQKMMDHVIKNFNALA